LTSADTLLARAEEALARGQEARAADLCNLALNRRPVAGDLAAALVALRARAEVSGRGGAGAAAAATPPPAAFVAGMEAWRLGRWGEAEELLRAAVDEAPHLAAAHAQLGVALLGRGAFAEGWRELEWRRQMPGSPGRDVVAPAWDGGRLAPHQTLLLWDEQGFGDSIQYARYAILAKAASGARVVLSCHPRVRRLLASCRGFDATFARGRDFPRPDAHCSLLSLPAILGLDDPRGDLCPYVGPLGDGPITVVNKRGSIRVGVAWQGNPRFPGDPERSVPLGRLEPLLRALAGVRAGEKKVHLLSLQRGPGEDQLATLPADVRPSPLGRDLDAGSDGFVDSAALLNTVDLLITSDTAIAHLGGAMGVPVWLLLARVPDWRWGLNGERSVFYPSMRLFRQRRDGDWDGVCDDVRAAVAERFAWS
jgi:hypothetical protein